MNLISASSQLNLICIPGGPIMVIIPNIHCWREGGGAGTHINFVLKFLTIIQL